MINTISTLVGALIFFAIVWWITEKIFFNLAKNTASKLKKEIVREILHKLMPEKYDASGEEYESRSEVANTEKYQKQVFIEPYLLELIKNKSASNKLKLIAAWDGLSIETQIKLLSSKKETDKKNEHFFSFPDEVIKKALGSNNDYVKYLAVIHSQFGRSWKTFHDEIEKISMNSDANILLKFAASRYNYNISADNPADFFTLPENEKCLYFSELCFSDAQEIDAIINYGIDNALLDKQLLHSLLIECKHNLKKKKDFLPDDGLSLYLEIQDEIKLLKLVITIYNTFDSNDKDVYPFNLSNILLLALPCPSNSEEVENTLLQFPEKLLCDFLSRNDVYLSNFRKKILFSVNGKYNEHTIRAAISANCWLDKNDFMALRKRKSLYREHAYELNRLERNLIAKVADTNKI